MINVGLNISNHINQMITITGYLSMANMTIKFDHSNQQITLTVIDEHGLKIQATG